MVVLARLLAHPLTRWLIVAVVLAALSGAWIGERKAHRVTSLALHDMTVSRDAWAGAHKRCVAEGVTLQATNSAIATAAATQCGAGQASAFERGRAFGRAEAGAAQ